MRPVGLEVPPAPVLPRESYPPAPNFETPSDQLPRPLAVAATIVRSDPRFEGTGLPELAARAPRQDITSLMCRKQLVRYVTDELVSTATRAVQEVTVYKDGAPITCTEESGHMERHNGRFVLVPGQTVSSDASKREAKAHPYLRHYNANLAMVKLDGAALAVRSGRSDTPQKIEEALLFGAVHSGRATYQSAIVGGMDENIIKKWFTRLVGGEDESLFLKRQRESINSLFAGHPLLAYPLTDGRTVNIARPLQLNLVFSGQARNVLNVLAARYRNKAAASQLYDIYAQRCAHPALGRALRSAVSDAQKAHTLTHVVPEILQDPAVTRADMLSVSALSLILTGRDTEGSRHLYPASAASELMLLGTLLKQCDIVPHVQCKSGLDRTPAMSATLIAAALFEKLRGALCTPTEMWQQAGNLSLLQNLFTQAADTFGAQHIRLVRGAKGAVKWGLGNWLGNGKPVPQALYLPYNSKLGVKPALHEFSAGEPGMLARACGTASSWLGSWWTAGHAQGYTRLA